MPAALAAAVGACSGDDGNITPGPRDAGQAEGGRDGGPGPDAPPDSGVDTGPCGTLTECGSDCADLARNALHCGRCDVACPAPGDAEAVCALGICGFACLPGFVVEGDACAPAPRPVYPPGTSTVTSRRPTLRWVMPVGAMEAMVELCEDRACGTVIETISVTGTTTTPGSDLPSGTVFWRVTAIGRTGPTWQVTVGRRTAPTDLAWGVSPDFDGDGLGDVAIGAPTASSSEGRVHVFRGATGGTASSPTAVLPGLDGAGGELGLALTCAGDVNGDGFADLAVGAPGAGAGTGRAYVFFGGPDGLGDAPSEVIDPPDGDGRRFGGAIAGAGDFDADGWADVVVAAVGEGVTPGRIHFFRGSPRGLEASPVRTVIGAGRFGAAVAGAGDVNGDGYSDVVAGAPAASTSRGEVGLFLGGPGGPAAVADAILVGPDADGQFGFSVAGAGDLDGDGLADVAVGAPATDRSVGRVHVFYGAETGFSTAPALSLAGLTSGGGVFGHAVAGLGDGDGDGFDDLAVGAFGVDGRRGRVAVFLGGATGLVGSTRTNVDGPYGGEGDFGWALASAGDVDGNGRPDLAVGAPGADTRSGRAYLFRGAAGGVGTTALVTLVGPPGGAFGRAVAQVGQ